MAQMTIQLRTDPVTGKKDILVKLDSDPDSLPQEHEALHRQLVEKLIGQGVLQANEVGQVHIEREEGQAQSETTSEPASNPESEAKRESEGGKA